MGSKATRSFTKQAEMSISYQQPAPVMLSNRKALTEFIGWAAEAIEHCPLNDDAKAVVDRLIEDQQKPLGDYIALSVKRLSGFAQWIEEAERCHPMSDEARKTTGTLASYCDHLDRYQSQLRNYWFR